MMMFSVNNILSTKRVLILVSIAILIKLSIPIAVNEIPAIWSVILSWLKPPYLYIVINFIIVTILASSRFHVATSEPPAIKITTPLPPAPADVFASTAHDQQQEMVMVDSYDDVDESTAQIHGEKEMINIDAVDEAGHRRHHDVASDDEVVPIRDHEDDVVVGEKSTLLSNYDAPPIISEEVLLTESLLPVREKPLVSTRFGHRRTSLHEGSGVRALRVARPKKQETLESTWKMVTEGRHVPLARHLKTKSERWPEHVTTDTAHVPVESETFKERTSYSNNSMNYHRVNARIRKEPSLGQDELNRRVEAFINKFNEDMRMQRQESLNRFMEMINRGV